MRIRCDGSARLVNFLFVDEHTTGKDQRTGALPARNQASINQQQIDAGFSVSSQGLSSFPGSRCAGSIWNSSAVRNLFVTEILRLNREYAPSKRPVSFVCFEKSQPGMVLSEHLFKFRLAQNHARGGERIRFSGSIGENPGTVLPQCRAAGPRIKNMGSLHRQS